MAEMPMTSRSSNMNPSILLHQLDKIASLHACALELGRKRQQRDIPRLLDGLGELALVRGADAREPARRDLAPLRHELLQEANVAIADGVNFFHAEFADFLAAEELAAAASARTAGGPGWTRSGRRPFRRTLISALRGCGRGGCAGFVSHG